MSYKGEYEKRLVIAWPFYAVLIARDCLSVTICLSELRCFLASVIGAKIL